jgi:hypothetical protein
MIRLRSLALILALAALTLSPAQAAEKAKPKTAAAPAPKQADKPAKPKAETLGKFGNWSAYVVYEGKNPVCYMSLTARPPEAKGAKVKRDPVTLMVTHRPAESSSDVISYSAGMKFKAGTDVEIHIGEKNFSLFTQDDTAWARDALTDRSIATAMRSGVGQMTLTGTSVTGKNFGDTIPLKGADEAYYAASKACGLKADKPASEKPAAPKSAPSKKEAVKKPAAPQKETVTKPKQPSKPKEPIKTKALHPVKDERKAR